MTILPNNILILSNDLLYISGNVYRLIAANNIGLYGCHECIFREVDLLLFSHECKLSVRLYINGKYTMYKEYDTLCRYLNVHMSYSVKQYEHFRLISKVNLLLALYITHKLSKKKHEDLRS